MECTSLMQVQSSTDEVEYIVQGINPIDSSHYEFPLDMFLTKDEPYTPCVPEDVELPEDLPEDMMVDTELENVLFDNDDDDMGDTLSNGDAQQEVPSTLDIPEEALQAAAAAAASFFAASEASRAADSSVKQVPTSVFSMESFVTPGSTGKSLTKSQHAFNLLGCIVYMARFGKTDMGCEPSRKLYGKESIVDQVARFTEDPNNGVVHDVEGRSVTINRKTLYDLVQGSDDLDSCDRIISYFGNEGDVSKISKANVRKYFSGLKSSWDANSSGATSGGSEAYLNTFEYIIGGPMSCYFRFRY